MQAHANRDSASSPTQGPIATCIATLRDLAPSAKSLHRAFRDVSRQVARIDDPRRDILKSEWATYTKRYKSVVDDSDVAAGKLAAVINVYLALESNAQETRKVDMITELTTLKSELDGCNFDFDASCANLKGNIGSFYVQLVDPMGDRRESEGALLADMFPNAQPESTSQTTRQPEAIISSVTYVSQLLWRMWGLLIGQLPTLYATTSPQVAPSFGTTGNLTLASTTALKVSAGAGTIDTHVQPSQHAQDTLGSVHGYTPTPLTSDKPVHAVVGTSIKDIMRSLGRQTSQLDVFRELTLHLKNEIEAYLQALQSANAFPTPEKRAVLANMLSRAVLSSAHWRACVLALTDGYSRIQK
ncbi:hypothetical protein C8Q73DRAFT_193801 [Cubamyces lactineus]|nr:hypothetical protein C8Q73DRAFT_193801 [Cubamyces lactineus]